MTEDIEAIVSYCLAMASNSSTFLPPRFVVRTAWRIHRALFRLSRGRFGLSASKPDKEGLAEMVTIGHRSGQERSVMFAYYEDGEDLVTMAMNGWSPGEPAWWKNMQANPEVQVTTVNGTMSMVGRAAQAGEEHDRLWDRWRELDRWVDAHSSRRPEGTPVIILSPTT